MPCSPPHGRVRQWSKVGDSMWAPHVILYLAGSGRSILAGSGRSIFSGYCCPRVQHEHSSSQQAVTAAPAMASGSNSLERVLSHGDVVLIRSDLAILRGPCFINDRIIAFYFAHLSAGLQDDDDDGLLLLPPSIPYLLSNLPDTAAVAAVADPLRLASRRLVLLPVNDNPDASVAEGGSHWTLLILDNGVASPSSAPRFVHHDSLPGAPNLPVAVRLADALRPLLSSSDSKRDTILLIEGPTPRQTNGYDCGVYVMAIARALCAWWKNNCQDHREGGDWFQAVRKEVDAHSVKAMRADLLQLINTLQEKVKANSTTSKDDTDPVSLE